MEGDANHDETIDPAQAAKQAAEWERCKPWIADALRYGQNFVTLDDVTAGLKTNHYLLVMMMECMKSGLTDRLREWQMVAAARVSTLELYRDVEDGEVVH